MLHRIYLVCHGETVDQTDDEQDAYYPTENPADVPLSKTGVEQAKQTADRLAMENLPIDLVYSSPSYQCLETLLPIVTTPDGRPKFTVRVEPGLRESQDIDDVFPLCSEVCALKRPTDISDLIDHFNYIDTKYRPLVTPPLKGWLLEPPRRLLLRAHFTMDHLIQTLDAARSPQVILICTHAEVVLAIARVLTSRNLPCWTDYTPNYESFFGELRRRIKRIAMTDLCQPDHHVFNCSITRLDRAASSVDSWAWTLSMNGAHSHLLHQTGEFQFRPSPWQNRHTPHPVLSAMAFINEFPSSMLAIPLATATSTLKTARETVHAIQRQMRANPYRLPAWIYCALWFWLGLAITARLGMLYYFAERLRLARNLEDIIIFRNAFLDGIANACAVLVQFSLFMFPPLLA
ncbi:phosphoglycerate mutase-like protein [Westerdykella ornata]|uniref:Phosphoglycerate mutase-like protein n=1 Tax=Westerdykella ornata TaxID=318751 RepID=A0A6A6JHE9_WESOR|nr:phosphoglycerate mutase-like protein [Westerdykella ornata]KAF2274669.1 phosphoglycerate mutase-like protein [Westerdykella ornata]